MASNTVHAAPKYIIVDGRKKYFCQLSSKPRIAKKVLQKFKEEGLFISIPTAAVHDVLAANKGKTQKYSNIDEVESDTFDTNISDEKHVELINIGKWQKNKSHLCISKSAGSMNHCLANKTCGLNTTECCSVTNTTREKKSKVLYEDIIRFFAKGGKPGEALTLNKHSRKKDGEETTLKTLDTYNNVPSAKTEISRIKQEEASFCDTSTVVQPATAAMSSCGGQFCDILEHANRLPIQLAGCTSLSRDTHLTVKTEHEWEQPVIG